MDWLRESKSAGRKIVMLTCYDYRTAAWQEEAGVDVVFVGDSVGTNVLGYGSETEVSLEEMKYHLRMVRRGVREAYLLADMPYRTYETPDDALETARQLLALGADGVKLEGMHPAIVRHLAERGIEVCAHIGYTPQYHETVAMQGKTFEDAKALLEGALALERAGASMLVVELVPEEAAAALTRRLAIPTIGIAAGKHTDGQVLSVNDLLGINPRKLRHVKRYADVGERAQAAIRAYAEDVRQGAFPEASHSRPMQEEERRRLEEWLNGNEIAKGRNDR